MRIRVGGVLRRMTILILASGMLWASGAAAETITFSGSVAYTDRLNPAHTLYVAVLDTSGAGDATVLARHSYQVTTTPIALRYSLDFDNTGVSPQVAVVGLADVDGGGPDTVSSADVFGWYHGGPGPTFVSSTVSREDLDFALPYASVQGTLKFAAGQTEARVRFSPDVQCLLKGFRPTAVFTSEGAYKVAGVYEGTYCVRAEGTGTKGHTFICYGDPTCADPTLVTVGPESIRSGIDFDFTSAVPVLHTTWGMLKSRYP